jgi:hypothetical protein
LSSGLGLSNDIGHGSRCRAIRNGQIDGGLFCTNVPAGGFWAMTRGWMKA